MCFVVGSVVLSLGGDAGAIGSSAGRWSDFAVSASAAATDVRRVDSGDFKGDEADAFREKLNRDLPPHLDTTAAAWTSVSRSLATYARTLEDLQQRLATVSGQVGDQQSVVASASAAVADARTADARHAAAVQGQAAALPPGEAAPPDTYRSPTAAASSELSAATAALQSMTDAANRIHAEHDAAVDACVGVITSAAVTRFQEPPGFWSRLSHSVGGWIADHAKVLTAISGALKQISCVAGLLAMIPVLAPVMGPIAVATGAGALVIDGAVMTATGHGSMTDLVVDAAGLIPGGRVAAGISRGVGLARAAGVDLVRGVRLARGARLGAESVVGARGAATLGEEARGLGTVAADARGAEVELTGSRAVDYADAAAAHDTPVESLPCVGDPIDVVTGEMVLCATDLTLPGVLPLVLRRVYKSGYRWGRVFGSSWASTLDQRVELGSAGAACFVAEDGVVLHYQGVVGGSAGPFLPIEGVQRWPLRRLAGGGWAVEDPEARVVRRFASADAGGRCALVQIADVHGNTIDFGYDAGGVVAEVTHSGGYRVAVTTTGGRVTGLSVHGGVDGATSVAAFGYDGAGQLVRVGDADGVPLMFQWAGGRIVGWRDRNGIWYRYSYDEAGRCVRTAGRGRVLSYGFSYLPGRTLVTNSLGAVTGYEFNAVNQVVRVVDPLGGVTSSVWDHYDRLLLRTDPIGRSTQFRYDHAGQLIEVIGPDGSGESLHRNGEGFPVAVTDATGGTWRYGYDPAGSVTSTTDPLGAVTVFSRADGGGIESVTDPVGAVIRVHRNPAGLPVQMVDPLGAATTFHYDHMGRLVRRVDPLGGQTMFGWTADGRLAHQVAPDRSRQEWTWDGEGNLTGHADANGGRTDVEIGIFDLPVARTTPDGARLTFGYDTELRLTCVQNPAGLRWSHRYDAAGRLVAETDFNGRVQRYSYDAAGQLTGVINGLGEQTTLAYDQAGHLVQRATCDGVTQYSYDTAGRVVSAGSPSAVVQLDRDACGRVVRETVNGRSVTAGFDAAGRRVSRLTPAGVLSRWTFDAAGRPDALTTAGQGVSFHFDAAGREVERRFSAGGTLQQHFDAADRLTRQVMTGTFDRLGASALTDRRFDYRVDGALTGVVDEVTGGFRRFDLDTPGRVVRVQAAGWTEKYAYDRSGAINAASVTEAAASHDRRPAGNDNLADGREYSGTLITRAGRVAYRHDRQGRVVSRIRRRLSQRPEVWQFHYDSDDRMVAATFAGRRWSYTYDAFGRRISKKLLDAAGRTVEHTAFSWDGDQLVEQAVHAGSAAGAEVTTWDYLPGSWQPVSQTVCGTNLDAQFYAIVSDLVGTPTELVTPDGTQVAWTNADATVWGHPRPSTAAHTSYKYPPNRVRCPLRFPGQYADQETGLHYNRHRYYDPHPARYTTSDPLGLAPADDPHSYVPNPTTWADPLGLTPCNPGAASSEVSANSQLVNLASAHQTEHILDGNDGGGGHLWPARPGKTPFPMHWTREEIMDRVSDIATDPSLRWIQQDGPEGANFTRAGDPVRYRVTGIRNGVKVRVVIEPFGRGIITAHPVQ